MFIACTKCQRTMPHYRVYARKATVSNRCPCGSNEFRPVLLPEWKAAIWVLLVGWLWRKVIRREVEWDPRMPIREA